MIIATNHLSLVDTPVLFDNPRRPDITALVTTKYMKYPFVKWFINSGEGIWIDRDTADFGAFRKAVEALKRGWAVGISPEGTRSHDGQLQEGKPGAVLLALRSNVPIVPVACLAPNMPWMISNICASRTWWRTLAPHLPCHNSLTMNAKVSSNATPTKSCAVLPHCSRNNIAASIKISRA